MNPAFADFRSAIRRFFNRPAESLLAVILLSVGISANISAFVVIEALCWTPSPGASGKLAQLEGSPPPASGAQWSPSDGPGRPRKTLQSVDDDWRKVETVAPGPGQPSTSLLVAFGVASLLFLVASANAASLVVAHSRARETELAIRRAMRTGAARLLRRWAWEAFLVSALSGVAGLMMSNRAIFEIGGSTRSGTHPAVPWESSPALFALLATAIGALLVLALPAARLARPALAATLGLSGGADPSGPRLRRTGAIGAMMLSLLAMAGCGLLLSRSLGPTAVQPAWDANSATRPEFSLASDRDGSTASPAKPAPGGDPGMEPVL